MKKLLTLTALTLLSATSIASTSSPYTMAVIKNSSGADEIKQGLFEQGIADITSMASELAKEDMIAAQMNLCVAYANTEDFDNANAACDKAIEISSDFKRYDSQAKRVAALALNNRAILKAKSNDYDGALEDLMLALDVKKHQAIEKNLLKVQTLQAQTAQSAKTQSDEV